MGGREILIKAIAQAIPTYIMSCPLLPQGLSDDIEIMVRNFWWGQRQQESKMDWVSWKTMCMPKAQGGMWFQEFASFQQSNACKAIMANPPKPKLSSGKGSQS